MSSPLAHSTTVTPSREQPHRGDHLPTLLSQPKLSPTLAQAQRLLSQVDSQAAGCPPCHAWLANTFLADLSSLCISTHAMLHCQWSSPRSPAAPCPTGSISTQQQQPGESSVPHAAAARSARARLAASVPEPSPSRRAAVPRLPGMATAALNCCAK